jgi:nitrogen fixation NifU-like protein
VIDEALRELYQEVILDHGKHPRNYGKPETSNRKAQGNNPLCGDRITVFLNVTDDGVIESAAFDGRGCAISMASASMMTDMLRGKTVAEAEQLFENFHKMCTTDEDGAPADGAFADDMEKLQVLSGVRQFPMRVKCATLAWHTMDAAVNGEAETTTE